MKRKSKRYKHNSVHRPNRKKEISISTKLGLSNINLKPFFFDFDEEKVSNYTPRLMAAAKEFNIGANTLIELLGSKGFKSDDLKPTSKLNREMYLQLLQQYDPEKLKKIEVESDESKNNENYQIVLTFENGKYVVKKQFADGTAIYANGEETIEGIFIPYYFSSFTNVLKELEELINYPDISENDIQKFLEKHPELILENDYKNFIPQARVITEDKDWEADFVLVPFEQENFCKIIELKLPKEKLGSSEKNGHMRLSRKLLHSLQQIKDYHNAFDSEKTRAKFKEKYGTNVYRPELELIIGRKGDMQLKRNFIDTQKETGVKITDWDTFLEKRKRIFK